MTTYAFQDVTASLVGPSGVFSLGYGEATADEGIDIVQSGDKNTMTTGSDGEGMHSLHASKSGIITVRLLKVAPANAKLLTAYNAQALDSRLWGKNLITVSNTASADLHVARSCAFKKVPDIKYAKEGDILIWQFDCIKIDNLLGVY